MSDFANKEPRPLPAGWQVFDSYQFVSPEERQARGFADRILADFHRYCDIYASSGNRVLLYANAPSDKIIDRARSIVQDRGHRNLLNWCRVVGGARVVCLDVYPQSDLSTN